MRADGDGTELFQAKEVLAGLCGVDVLGEVFRLSLMSVVILLAAIRHDSPSCGAPLTLVVPGTEM